MKYASPKFKHWFSTKGLNGSTYFFRDMLSTVKLIYPHTDGNIGIVPWLAELPALLQKGLYADVVLHPMKEENSSSGTAKYV